MRESTVVWGALKRKLGTRLWLERSEVRNRGGIPDVIWLHKETGHVGRLELKYVRAREFRSDGTFDLGLSLAQATFLVTWAKNGGRGAVLARLDDPVAGERWCFWRTPPDSSWKLAVVGKCPEERVSARRAGPLDPGWLLSLLIEQ